MSMAPSAIIIATSAVLGIFPFPTKPDALTIRASALRA